MVRSDSVREFEAKKILIFVFFMTVSLYLQFRVQVNSGFALLYGDSYDATIVATILEHWFNVFQGFSSWSELNYFYPHAKTLGQTDGYFIAGLLYFPFRISGLDPYLSSELANVTLRGIGYVSFFVLSRRVFGLTFAWSLLGAILFVLSNNLTIHGQRLQLATVSLAPLMAWLLWELFVSIRDGRRGSILAYGAMSGIFLGAWSITCFYITWFFIYFFVFFIAVSILFSGAMGRRFIVESVKSHYVVLLAVLLIAAASLVPLLSVYLPKAAETGMRPYESALSNTVPWHGILQVGTENFMFGEIYNKFLRLLSPGYTPSGEYYNTGLAPILFVFAVAGALIILRRKESSPSRLLWVSLAVTTAVTWLGVLNIGGHSLWYILYHAFPGAKALNVVGAYQLLLSIPVILLAMHYMQSISASLPRLILVVLVMMLCMEELNQGYTQLNRSHELTKVSVSAPPEGCKAFYVSGWHGQDNITPMAVWVNNYYAHNVSAMLIAELVRLPTVNGVASFNPADWNFGFPNNSDYDQRVRAYTDKHGLSSICKFDLEARLWTKAW